MRQIRIRSVSEQFRRPEIGHRAINMINQAEAMGLLRKIGPVDHLDKKTWGRVVDKISDAGVGRGLEANLKNLEQFAATVQKLQNALAESPMPKTEWPALKRTLGGDQLASLLGISPSSLHRYSTRARRTPDGVAERLHFLALVIGDLAGAYNDLGLRRWFERKRTLLDGRSPAEILVGEWNPDDPGPSNVRRLANSLVYSPAT